MAKKKRRGQAPRPVTPATDEAALSPEERAARRAEQRREFAERKVAEREAANRSFAPLLWAVGVIVSVAIVIPIVLLVTSGGGDDDAPAAKTPAATLDPRLGGAAPMTTLRLTATDGGGQLANPRFEPTNLIARAGQVFQIDVTNTGTVFHNLTLDGGNNILEDWDDFTSDPLSIAPGTTAKLLAKLDTPGNYTFECNLHAGIQIGTVEVLPAGATGTTSGSATPAPSTTATP